ncbi:MAG: hypothetical protein ACLTZY_02160 [Alistipes indistinctus]
MGSAIRDPSPPDDQMDAPVLAADQAPATSFGVTPTNHASEFFCEVPVLPPMSAFSRNSPYAAGRTGVHDALEHTEHRMGRSAPKWRPATAT